MLIIGDAAVGPRGRREALESGRAIGLMLVFV